MLNKLKLISKDDRFTWNTVEQNYDQYYEDGNSFTEITGRYTHNKCKFVDGFTNSAACGYHSGKFPNIMPNVTMSHGRVCNCRRHIKLLLPPEIEIYLFSKNINPFDRFGDRRPIWYTSKTNTGKVYKVVFDKKMAKKEKKVHNYLFNLGLAKDKLDVVFFNSGAVIITTYAGRTFTDKDMDKYYPHLVITLKKHGIDKNMVDWNPENFCIDGDKIWFIDFESWSIDV